MAQIDPYIYAIGSGVFGALAFVGRWVINLVQGVITRAEQRGDRLEAKLLETHSLLYPVLTEANAAIREALAAAKKEP